MPRFYSAFKRALIFLTLLHPLQRADAQRPIGSVRGLVVDSAGQPIEGVEIVASTVGRVVRTDDNGRFHIDTVVDGLNRLLVRRLGWKAIDTTFQLDVRNPPALHFVMARVSQLLGEVRITTQDDCPSRTLEGFNCRRRAGIGAFRDSAEIAALKPICFANIFQGMSGLRIAPGVPCPQLVSTTGWRCLRVLVDGKPPVRAAGLKMTDYIGVEFYNEEDKVPEWYKNYAHEDATIAIPTHQAVRGGDMIYRTQSLPGRPCALVVYWTRFADRYDPHLDQSAGVTKAMRARRDSLNRYLLDSLRKRNP